MIAWFYIGSNRDRCDEIRVFLLDPRLERLQGGRGVVVSFARVATHNSLAGGYQQLLYGLNIRGVVFARRPHLFPDELLGCTHSLESRPVE